MAKFVTLQIPSSKLAKYQDVFPNVLQPTPITSTNQNSSLLSSSKPSIKKIIIKKPQAPLLPASSPIIPGSGNETPLTTLDTPLQTSNKGRSGMAASANGGLLDLDKSGKPCKRWIKGTRDFKSFTGYPITISMFREEI